MGRPRLVKQRSEAIEVDRFRQVFIEPGSQALFSLLRVHPPAERDCSGQRLSPLGFGHQIQAASVRQRHVTYERIETHTAQEIQSFSEASSRDNPVATTPEHPREEGPEFF